MLLIVEHVGPFVQKLMAHMVQHRDLFKILKKSRDN